LVCCWAGTSWIYGREWFRGFFDDTYLEILKAQGGMKLTRPEVDFLTKVLDARHGPD